MAACRTYRGRCARLISSAGASLVSGRLASFDLGQPACTENLDSDVVMIEAGWDLSWSDASGPHADTRAIKIEISGAQILKPRKICVMLPEGLPSLSLRVMALLSVRTRPTMFFVICS